MFVAPSKRNGFKERSYRAVLGSWEVLGVSSERSAGWQDEDEDAEVRMERKQNPPASPGSAPAPYQNFSPFSA